MVEETEKHPCYLTNQLSVHIGLQCLNDDAYFNFVPQEPFVIELVDAWFGDALK